MKLGFLSDLHYRFNEVEDRDLVSILSETVIKNELDLLILSGDTTNNAYETKRLVELANEQLDEGKVLFILGNHEYWSARINDYNQDLESDYYIHNKVIELNEDTVLIANNGWSDGSFVQESDYPDNFYLSKDKDTILSIGYTNFDLSRFRLKTNYTETGNIMKQDVSRMLEENKCKNIIMTTHWVPHREFLITKSPVDERSVIWNTLNAFMGSTFYEEMAQAYNIKHWVFGHTHTMWDAIIDGTHYHCNPIGYKNHDRIWDSDFKTQVEELLTIIEI